MNQVEKGALVESLWHAVDSGAQNLGAIPGLVRRVIETGAWERRIYNGKIYTNKTFLEFITSPPLKGCGWPPDKVAALIKGDEDTERLWRAATTGQQGAHAHSDNRTMRPRRGTTRAYTLDRLKRERPDLYERVVAKELSPNAAAIEAGWRQKPSPFAALRSAWKKARTAEERDHLIAEIKRFLAEISGGD